MKQVRAGARARAGITVLAAAAAVGSMTSCGSNGGAGGGGPVIGDLAADLVISTDTSAAEIRARNLTINPGVKVTSPGDLKIQAAAMASS